jgi:tetratricopeptide (TPR) repeat protein
MLGNYQQVLTDTAELLAAQPNSAEAHFMRASAHEGRNDIDLAIQDLEEASRLAQAAGNDTLYATARVRLGMLMQNSAGQPQQP